MYGPLISNEDLTICHSPEFDDCWENNIDCVAHLPPSVDLLMGKHHISSQLEDEEFGEESSADGDNVLDSFFRGGMQEEMFCSSLSDVTASSSSTIMDQSPTLHDIATSPTSSSPEHSNSRLPKRKDLMRFREFCTRGMKLTCKRCNSELNLINSMQLKSGCAIQRWGGCPQKMDSKGNHRQTICFECRAIYIDNRKCEHFPKSWCKSRSKTN